MKEIKIIIFDLDGTLYNLDDVVSMNYCMQVDFYSSYFQISAEDTIRIFEQNNIFPTMNEKSKSATEFFVRSGVPTSEWNEFREHNFNVEVINRATTADIKILKKFTEIAPMILLSSNSLNNIHKILKWIEIDDGLFDEIICSDNKYGDGSFRKVDEMRLIAERRGILTSAILSIGDRYKTDVEPILSLGGMGVVVDFPCQLEEFYNELVGDNFTMKQIYNL